MPVTSPASNSKAAVAAAADSDRLEWDILRQTISATTLSVSIANALKVHTLILQSIVLQCTFVARVLRELKALTHDEELGLPLTETLAPTAIAASPIQLSIGLIGCGTVGSAILNALLGSGLFHKTSFIVSTRQPQLLDIYRDAGVHCCFDNRYVAEQSDLLFLCCLPGQVATVADDVRGRMRPHALLMSVCVGVFADRLGSMFAHPFALTTHLKPHLVSEHFSPDDIIANNATLKRDLILLTCPFDGPDFFNHLLFGMTVPSYNLRGFSIERSIQIALLALLNGSLAVPPNLASFLTSKSVTPNSPNRSTESDEEDPSLASTDGTSPPSGPSKKSGGTKKHTWLSSSSSKKKTAHSYAAQLSTSKLWELCSPEFIGRVIFQKEMHQFIPMLRSRYADVSNNVV